METKRMKFRMDGLAETCRALFNASPTKTPSPYKAEYLTKYTNTTGFVALDVNEKLGEVDDTIRQMKEFMDSSLSDRRAADEALEWQKKRSGFCSDMIPNS